MLQANMSAVRGPGLYEFLIEAELQQYYAGIKNDLKVNNYDYGPGLTNFYSEIIFLIIDPLPCLTQ
jgi:hypothetical protein